MGKERIVAIVLLAAILVFCIVHLVLTNTSVMSGKWVFAMLFTGSACSRLSQRGIRHHMLNDMHDALDWNSDDEALMEEAKAQGCSQLVQNHSSTMCSVRTAYTYEVENGC